MFNRNPGCSALLRPSIHSITSQPVEGSNRAARRLVTKVHAADIVQRTNKTIENWIGLGFITGYRDPQSRRIYIDVDELEAALRNNPRMRDGRKVYGRNSRIVSLPNVIRAEPVTDGSDQ